VQEVTPERVTLQIAPDQPAPAPPAATQASPNEVIGAFTPVAERVQAKVEVDERPARRPGADGEPADVVSLAFTSPTLGRLDLRLELRGERLLTEITTPAGRSHAIATEASERLRARLEAAGLEATVTVRPRHQPLDLYA
jgi:Flagellar hook-length control protein FliK